jgi:hypothetical protein
MQARQNNKSKNVMLYVAYYLIRNFFFALRCIHNHTRCSDLSREINEPLPHASEKLDTLSVKPVP